MKANRNSRMSAVVFITLNGKDMVQGGGCLGGNEETGEVLMLYRDARGKEVPGLGAEVGSLIVDDLQVIVLKGKVEVSINKSTIREGTVAGIDPQELLDDWTREYQPVLVMRKVKFGGLNCLAGMALRVTFFR